MNFKKISCLSLGLLFCSNLCHLPANAMTKSSTTEKINKTETVSKKDQKKIIDVPYINQDDIVYGCEAVSSTMLLKFYGYDINEKDFTDKYLIQKDWHMEGEKIYGPDPDAAFPGNPYISGGLNCGFGSYSPSTAKSINKVLDGSKHKAISEKGLSLESIVEKYIDNDIPVLIWATMDMKEPKKTTTWTINYVDENSKLKIGDQFTWISGEHCLVLVGYDKDNYYFNDPYKNHGLIAYDKKLVQKRYKAMGKQSIHIDVLDSAQDTSNTDKITNKAD